MRKKGDKLLQVAMINHLLKGDIFPSVSRVHSDPEGVTTNLPRGHTSSSTLPPHLSSLLTPYRLQRPLPHEPLTHVHILYMRAHTRAHSSLSARSLSPLRCPHQVICFHRAASSNLFCVYRPWPDCLCAGMRWSLWDLWRETCLPLLHIVIQSFHPQKN